MRLALKLARWIAKVTYEVIATVLIALGVLGLICLAPLGWIILLWVWMSSARERRHQELLKAIERR